MNAVAVVVTLAIWVPLVGLVRAVTVRLVAQHKGSPRAGAAGMALAYASLPMLVLLTGAVQSDPVFLSALATLFAVLAYRGYSATLRRASRG